VRENWAIIMVFSVIVGAFFIPDDFFTTEPIGSQSDIESEGEKLRKIFTNDDGKIYERGIFTQPGVTFSFSYQADAYGGRGDYLVKAISLTMSIPCAKSHFSALSINSSASLRLNDRCGRVDDFPALVSRSRCFG